MTVTFNPQAIYNRIAGRVEDAVTQTAHLIAEDARERAPVRKVFQGSHGTATLQSTEEAAAEVAVRTRIGLAPGPVRTQRTPAARVHRFGPRRLLASPAFDPRVSRFRGQSGRFESSAGQSNRLVFDTPTTSRGRYEIRTGRANIFINGQAFVGGRLRREITATAAEGGPVYVAQVRSPTPYAKYVEFGTRHNRAQPYLRPALAAQRETFRSRLKRAVG